MVSRSKIHEGNNLISHSRLRFFNELVVYIHKFSKILNMIFEMKEEL